MLGNQYGKPGRSTQKFPPESTGARGQEDTIEGDLPEDVLVANRNDQTKDNEANRYRDDEYYASKEFNLEDIEVPVLSVANWGGILLHLRGNVQGYIHAGSNNKWLRFITGRHDLPFYYPEEVEIQKGFMDAFLKGEDSNGWTTPGKIAPVTLTLRKGNVGFNDAKAEKAYTKREESSWPISRTQYTKFYLTPDFGLTTISPRAPKSIVTYKTMGTLDNQQFVQFKTPEFEAETEITGHIVAHLNVSATPEATPSPKEVDMDLHVILRHLDPSGKEVLYTGTTGDGIPLCKGWLRVSLRKVNETHLKHRAYLPYRDYFSTDEQLLEADQVYAVDVEIWPTNVVVEKGGRLVFEVSSGDTHGVGIFQHNSETDRPVSKFSGMNSIHFDTELENYVTLPIIPGIEG